MSAAFDWRDATMRLIALAREAADRALTDPGPEVPPGIINSRNAGRILIEAGREDIEQAASLLCALDGLPERERQSAYAGLHSLIRGISRIAGQTATHADLPRAVEELNSVFMRSRRSGQVKSHRKAVRRIYSELTANGRLVLKVLLPALNERLEKEKLPTISERTLSRILREARQ
jgi:hypothetical protein